MNLKEFINCLEKIYLSKGNLLVLNRNYEHLGDTSYILDKNDIEIVNNVIYLS